jgi:hypothetical protein
MTFRFEPELDDMMNQSIEMGRAFIMGIPAETHASFLALERNIHTTLGTQIPSWWGKHQQFSNFRNL